MSTEEFALSLESGHLYVEMAGQHWLLDTGSPVSFGEMRSVRLAGQDFAVEEQGVGLDAKSLRKYVGHDCVGLLGMDVLGSTDLFFDVPNRRLVASGGDLHFEGVEVPVDHVLGIPIVQVQIGGHDFRMFLDTGAQYGYLQDDVLGSFPSLGIAADFHPSLGSFEAELHRVAVSLGGGEFTMTTGQLPGLLGLSLGLADTQGIVGSELFSAKRVVYSPRRGLLALSEC